MADVLTPEEVDRIARLARLALTADERSLYARQLTRILEYARQIAELPTQDVAPMIRADEKPALERPDEVRPSLPREEALGGAPETAAGLFVVPRAVGGDT